MKAMAKNIVAGTVEVEVVAVYSETAYEVFVPSQGGKTIVQKQDLTFENIEDQKALELKRVLKEDFGMDSVIEGNAGEDLNVTFKNYTDRPGYEIVTIFINEKSFEIETNKVDIDGIIEEAKNVRKIAKMETLVKWLEKRIG